MLKKTLDALARLDYPNFEVLIIDNNTKDEKIWRPVEEYCATLGDRLRSFHAAPLRGYKAGALYLARTNNAPDIELVGVLDRDYLGGTDSPKFVVTIFHRPGICFVQAPPDSSHSTPD